MLGGRITSGSGWGSNNHRSYGSSCRSVLLGVGLVLALLPLADTAGASAHLEARRAQPGVMRLGRLVRYPFRIDAIHAADAILLFTNFPVLRRSRGVRAEIEEFGRLRHFAVVTADAAAARLALLLLGVRCNREADHRGRGDQRRVGGECGRDEMEACRLELRRRVQQVRQGLHRRRVGGPRLAGERRRHRLLLSHRGRGHCADVRQRSVHQHVLVRCGLGLGLQVQVRQVQLAHGRHRRRHHRQRAHVRLRRQHVDATRTDTTDAGTRLAQRRRTLLLLLPAGRVDAGRGRSRSEIHRGVAIARGEVAWSAAT